MIEIRKAQKSDQDIVLKMLDDFRTFVALVVDKVAAESTTARDNGPHIYKNIVTSPDSGIFYALANNEAAGIITVHKVPTLRKGMYKAEIEELFVYQKYHGTDVAKLLMDEAKKWCKENHITSITLESGYELERAHSFYKKMGFRDFGKAFICTEF